MCLCIIPPQDRLELSVLRDNIKLKQRIKCKGRPKNSSKLWPSKKKNTSKTVCGGKENQPHVSCDESEVNSHELAPKCKRRRIPKTYQPGTAANRLRIKRDQKRKMMAGSTHDDGTKECIVLPTDDEDFSEEQACMTVSGITLFQSDVDILESPRAWLNERLINVGQALMKEKFPHVSGLQDVGRNDTCTFEEEVGCFVQILNCCNSHWICATNINCKSNEVHIFDSMRTGDIPLSTKEVVASLMKLSQTYIFLTFPDVQQQVGGSECGLYSLAFAYSLCSGRDPARLEYNQAHFREHLLQCLRKREISDFPHSAVMKNPKKPLLRKFAVYCLCRLPNTGDSMVQCSKCLEWFHFTCIDLEEDAQLPEEWCCTACTIKN